VDGRSTIDEWAFPLKSTETSSSSVASRMPRSRPAAASRNAVLIWSTEAVFSSSATRSTTETFAVGTRTAIPSSLPLSFGSTSPTAVAAPVVVGIMLTAAARGRRRCLRGRRDDDLLRAGAKVLGRVRGVAEEPRRFHDDVDAELLPRKRRGIALRAHAHLAAVHEDRLALGRDLGRQGPVDRIVLEEMGQSLRVREIVDAHHFEIVGAERGAEEHPSDTTESVDPASNGHGRLLT